jgi:hypothetical protein
VRGHARAAMQPKIGSAEFQKFASWAAADLRPGARIMHADHCTITEINVLDQGTRMHRSMTAATVLRRAVSMRIAAYTVVFAACAGHSTAYRLCVHATS